MEVNEIYYDDFFDSCSKYAKNWNDDKIKELIRNQSFARFDANKECLSMVFLTYCESGNIEMIDTILDGNHLSLNKIGFLGLIYSLIYDKFNVVEHIIFEKNCPEHIINWDLEFEGKDVLNKLFLARNLQKELIK